jgi:hypothetical protein
LSYCVKDQNQEVLALKKFDLYTSLTLDQQRLFSSTYQEIWANDELLSLPFAHINLAFIHPFYTIVPNKLYQAANKESYLSPLKQKPAGEEVFFTNDLAKLHAKLIFSLPKTATDFFEGQYGNKAIYHNNFSALIKGITALMDQGKEKKVWVNVHPNILQILFFDGKELIFSNQFPFQSEKDFLYYVLLVYSQFKLEPEKTPLYISGQLVKESSIYKNLYRYIRELSFLKIPKTYKLNKQLSDSPLHFFFDLLSLS